MKVVAFNCSPRARKSNTDKILNPLLKGAGEAGAEVEKVYLRRLKLRPCTGCLSCWLETPGICVQRDDWAIALGKFAKADTLIFATPLYFLNMTVYMKNLLERVGMPAILPYGATQVNGRFSHFSRYPDLKKRVVLVANGLGWGDDIFSPLVETLESSFSRSLDKDGNPVMEIVGKIIVGCGELLGWDETPQKDLAPFFERLRQAGEELVRNNAISPELEDELNVPLWRYLGINDDRQAIDLVNNHYRRVVEQSGGTLS